MPTLEYSIIAPVYNEIGCVAELYRRVRAVMDALVTADETWELIIVDDGSRDGSTQAILSLAEQDAHVRPVIFARNFGHQIAVTAGLDYARGEAVVIIDADLQDPPEIIPDLVAKWRQGYEVVYAVRAEREGETWFKKFTAAAFYRLIQRIPNVDIPVDTGDFRLIDRKVVDMIKQMRERHRFIRGMVAWVGFRQVGVSYHRAARMSGETKYPLKKMIKFALDAITSFSYVPLQLAMYMGFVSAGISIVAIPIVIFARLAGHGAFFGQATTLIAVLFLGGVQLISLGILGEYIGRLYDQAKERPLYIVRQAPRDENVK